MIFISKWNSFIYAYIWYGAAFTKQCSNKVIRTSTKIWRKVMRFPSKNFHELKENESWGSHTCHKQAKSWRLNSCSIRKNSCWGNSYWPCWDVQQLILNLWKGEIRQRNCDWFWVHYKMVKKMSNTRSVECSMVPSPKRSPVCWNNGLQTHACEYSHSNSGFLKALLVHILFFFKKSANNVSKMKLECLSASDETYFRCTEG